MNEISNLKIEENIYERSPDPTFEIIIIKRFFAFLIDNLILAIISVPVFIVFKINLFFVVSDATDFSILLFAVFFLHQIYFFVSEILWKGKTIGKSVFKIIVINNNGQRPDFISSLIRNFSRSIYFLPPLFFIPDLICLIITAFKKRIGDALSGTIVVNL